MTFKQQIDKDMKEQLKRDLNKKKTITGYVKICHDAIFHGIHCLELEDTYGFEGYYMGDINHPDHRPAHAIWINKKDAEKLWMIFKDRILDGVQY